jgi:hypothetical protein
MRAEAADGPIRPPLRAPSAGSRARPPPPTPPMPSTQNGALTAAQAIPEPESAGDSPVTSVQAPSHPTLDALRVPVASLHPYARNPRRGDVARIAESLRRHGQYRPVVVNARTQEVLAGNHTLAAAVELGWDEIAATFVDVDADTAARIVLVDNRSNDVAGYDDRALADLLADLGDDLGGTGYDRVTLDTLLASLVDPTSPDDFPDPEDGMETDFQCPQCGYEWSGLRKPTEDGDA